MPVVTAYLTKNFPVPKDTPEPVVIRRPVKGRFKARDPHTPLFDKNGIVWFTVQDGAIAESGINKVGFVTIR